MRNFLATVLSVIAAGVMLIAYGLLSPRAAATYAYAPGQPALVSERGGITDLTPRQPMAYAVSASRPEATRSVMKPALSRYRPTSSAMSGSSSTIRMRIGMHVILPVMTTVDPN